MRLSAWRAPRASKRGAQPISAHIAIATALALMLLLRLPLCRTGGFLGAIVKLMGLTLTYLDHPTRSRRHATVTIR